tara:strand:- start:916 stop:1944 length:1029 start_codon:yes stop_codon:yes gene_type:complete
MGLMTSEISAKQLVPLCRQMATSYDAGLPIVRTLELMSENSRESRAKQVFRDMAADARNGSTLSDAARKQQKYLPRFFIELLHSGELGGRLDIMLRDLADYYEDRLSMQRKIVGSMVYPMIQLTAAWFLGTFALGLIGSINLDSRKPFDLGEYFDGYFRFQGISMLVLAAILLTLFILSRLGVLRFGFGTLISYVWPLNVVNKKFSLARFFRSFALLVGSGMNIKSCIGNAAAISGNARMERDLLTAIPRVGEGATLVEAFAPCRSLSPMAREMLEVGERSGNLEASLQKVAQYHLEEGQHAMGIATKVMSTLIGLAMGGLVGYIVISYFSQYYKMLDSIMP